MKAIANMEPANFSIHTRSRGLALDGQMESSTSTPIASHYVLPTTPEQMEEIILARIAVATTAAARARSPIQFYDANQSMEDTTTLAQPTDSCQRKCTIPCIGTHLSV